MMTPSLQHARARVLDEMARLDQMIRGHVSEQTFRVQRGGPTVTQGPYDFGKHHNNTGQTRAFAE